MLTAGTGPGTAGGTNRMRRHLLRLTTTVTALVLGAVAATVAAGPAAAASRPDATPEAGRHAKRVEVFEFTRVAAPMRTEAAGPTAARAATTCYGGAIWQYTVVSPTTLRARGNTAFTTTTRCNDINMRKSTRVTWDVDACVIFVDHTPNCNYWTDISTSWQTIATDVRDTTHFKVVVAFWWPDATGTTAVQLAF
jgi:hypothetical protein